MGIPAAAETALTSDTSFPFASADELPAITSAIFSSPLRVTLLIRFTNYFLLGPVFTWFCPWFCHRFGHLSSLENGQKGVSGSQRLSIWTDGGQIPEVPWDFCKVIFEIFNFSHLGFFWEIENFREVCFDFVNRRVTSLCREILNFGKLLSMRSSKNWWCVL